jgi:glycosyltransferase involved in cell wall biosynthesis
VPHAKQSLANKTVRFQIRHAYSFVGGIVLGPFTHVSDVLCFSHLRWNFVFQRPQHLLTRCARHRRVFVIEEPMFDTVDAPYMTLADAQPRVHVMVPHLRESDRDREADIQRRLLDEVIAREDICPEVLWYYTPMSLRFSDHLNAPAVVYDCMDELSNFAGAPPGLREAERALLRRAGVVFTGGRSLHEAKKDLHQNIHPFPSSVDVDHFAKARSGNSPEPSDQDGLPHPRIGFFGVLDERFDSDLVGGLARLRAHYHFVLLGPVVKIEPSSLPAASNIHYLGQKSYAELPQYLGGWDVAMLPFARNESTRYISPTKTPEYLAGGRPVVSTSITDVVHPYGDLGLCRIADTPEEFAEAIDAALTEDPVARQQAADTLLATMSWDATWQAMSDHIDALCGKDSATCSITSSLVPASPAPLWPSASPRPLEKRF